VSSRTTWKRRAIACCAAVLPLLLSISLGCAAAFQPAAMQQGCCKGHCAMAASATPLVAVAPAKQRLDMTVLAAAAFPPRDIMFDAFSVLPHAGEAIPATFAPFETIPLRI
jgi:hypothetical protein